MLFDSFTGSRLADLETPEGGTRSSSHRSTQLPNRALTVAAAPQNARNGGRTTYGVPDETDRKDVSMASTSKRQQTMAKRNREQAVREKRELKLQKKHAAAAARSAEAAAAEAAMFPKPPEPQQ
jgi:hypothetical protein